MKVDVLQRYLTRLHFPDNELLKRSGLGKLASRFQAYPIIDEGKQFCVLLPRDVTPRAAAKMEGPQLSQRVIVLEQAASKWNKVFPSAVAPDSSESKVAAPAPAESGGILIIEDEA